MKHLSVGIKAVSKNHLAYGKKLEKKIVAFNEKKAGPTQWAPLGLEVRAEKGKWVGGLSGYTYLGSLYVEYLYLDPGYRGRDLGSELLERAEAWGKKKGCRHIHLNTYSFQAPGFYRKRGYKLFGKLGPHLKGLMRYYFKKDL